MDNNDPASDEDVDAISKLVHQYFTEFTQRTGHEPWDLSSHLLENQDQMPENPPQKIATESLHEIPSTSGSSEALTTQNCFELPLGPTQCQLCHVVLSCPYNLGQHLRRIHRVTQPLSYHCLICGQRFPRRNKLDEHLIDHEGGQ